MPPEIRKGVCYSGRTCSGQGNGRFKSLDDIIKKTKLYASCNEFIASEGEEAQYRSDFSYKLLDEETIPTHQLLSDDGSYLSETPKLVSGIDVDTERLPCSPTDFGAYQADL